MPREKSWLLPGLRSARYHLDLGRTESNNTVLHHLAQSLASEAEIWISATEHPCVRSGARHYFPGRHRLIPARRSGIVDLDWLEINLRASRPGAVAIMAANNETGVLQPWREIFSICRQHEVPLICDAAQWIGKEPAQGLGECEYVSGRAQIRRTQRRRISKSSATRTFIAPRRRTGSRAARRHGKCRWSPFHDRRSRTS
jgi:cysteine desulfurase